MAGPLAPVIEWVMANGALIVAFALGITVGILYMGFRIVAEIDDHVSTLQFQARLLGAIRVYEGRLEEELDDDEMAALRKKADEQGPAEVEELGLADENLRHGLMRILFGKFR